MELHPMHRPASVRQPHDLIVLSPGCDLQLTWQTVPRHRQAVIAGGDETVRHAFKKALATVPDRACLAMHDRVSRDHLASKSLADGLMTQAYAEDRQTRWGDRNQLQAYAGFIGRAWSW